MIEMVGTQRAMFGSGGGIGIGMAQPTLQELVRDRILLANQRFDNAGEIRRRVLAPAQEASNLHAQALLTLADAVAKVEKRLDQLA